MNDRGAAETQEFARNPNPEVRVACTKCKKDWKLDEMLHERSLPAPYNTMTEGYLLCPSCGDERHVYYMTELLRFKQAELKRAGVAWHETKLPREWTRYSTLQKKFQAMYDSAQKKYVELFKKETSA